MVCAADDAPDLPLSVGAWRAKHGGGIARREQLRNLREQTGNRGTMGYDPERTMRYEELRRLVMTAIAESAREVAASLGDETLGGYALCVDDSLRSLFPMAVSAGALSMADDTFRFVPVDWDCEAGGDAFDRANAALEELADDAGDYAAHMRLAFAALVDALGDARKSGTFAPGVTLLVTSVDPGETTRQLADEAVLGLNDAATQRAFRARMR